MSDNGYDHFLGQYTPPNCQNEPLAHPSFFGSMPRPQTSNFNWNGPNFNALVPPPPIRPSGTNGSNFNALVPPPPIRPSGTNVPNFNASVAPSLIRPTDRPNFEILPSRPATNQSASFHVPPPNFTQLPVAPTPPFRKNVNELSDNDMKNRFLQDWLTNINKPPVKKKKNKSFGLRDVQDKLLHYADLMRELEDISSLLSGFVAIDDRESLIKRADEIQEELESTTNFLHSNTEEISSLVENRRNKRARKKRSVARAVRTRQLTLRKRKEKEMVIDARIATIRERENRKLQDAKIKKEADSVLSEVRKKQEQTNELKSLIESLGRLRKVRLKKGEDQGFVTTPEQQQAFNEMADDLSKLADDQLINYGLEEKTLRAMMEESPMASKPVANENLCKKQIREIYFGTNTKQSDTDTVNSLVQRRNHWDQFIVIDSPLASSVPLGWVLPPTEPGPQWNKFQK